jgi:hypothetical protein
VAVFACIPGALRNWPLCDGQFGASNVVSGFGLDLSSGELRSPVYALRLSSEVLSAAMSG